MSKMVTVKFGIKVEGRLGGSFDMPKKDYDRILKKWESNSGRRADTDIADELLALAPFNYFNHLMVDEMEIEDLDVQP